jgi:predicted RNase H-like nuclease (RuvC/YqgF family)
VDKLADYEDELRQLKSQQDPNSNPTPPAGEPANLPARFTSYLRARGQSPSNSSTDARPPSSRRESDLQAALAREQDLRQKAEGQVNQMSGELEDLSQTLFEQANTMVANERKARAKLEERVEVLERRDVDKRKRLERLEGALRRIERVRGLLAP